MGAIAALDAAAFLAEEAIARPRLGQFLAQDFFGALVRSGDEVGRPLHRYLELLHLAEVAFERAAGKPRGFDHHIEQGGMRHDFEPVGYAAAARRQERAAYTSARAETTPSAGRRKTSGLVGAGKGVEPGLRRLLRIGALRRRQ